MGASIGSQSLRNAIPNPTSDARTVHATSWHLTVAMKVSHALNIQAVVDWCISLYHPSPPAFTPTKKTKKLEQARRSFTSQPAPIPIYTAMCISYTQNFPRMREDMLYWESSPLSGIFCIGRGDFLHLQQCHCTMMRFVELLGRRLANVSYGEWKKFVGCPVNRMHWHGLRWFTKLHGFKSNRMNYGTCASGSEGGWCRGWSRNVVGCWGFLSLGLQISFKCCSSFSWNILPLIVKTNSSQLLNVL